MSDYIDTREGWRRMLAGETADGRDMLQYEPNGDPEKAELWVREAPVPPLPTEPGYYIDDNGCAWRLDAGTWDDTFGNPLEDTGEAIQLPLTRYEPRAVTAKAVIDRAIELAIIVRRDVADTIRAEFGVES